MRKKQLEKESDMRETLLYYKAIIIQYEKPWANRCQKETELGKGIFFQLWPGKKLDIPYQKLNPDYGSKNTKS